MTLTQLRYLLAIADSGLNITLAAEKVHATQPGLSKQLKQLEDELGFILFTRGARSLESITPAGEKVIFAPSPPTYVATIKANCISPPHTRKHAMRCLPRWQP